MASAVHPNYIHNSHFHTIQKVLFNGHNVQEVSTNKVLTVTKVASSHTLGVKYSSISCSHAAQLNFTLNNKTMQNKSIRMLIGFSQQQVA